MNREKGLLRIKSVLYGTPFKHIFKYFKISSKRKTFYFHKMVRNDHVAPFKNRENNIQMSYSLYLRFFVDFAYLKIVSRKFIPMSLLHAKETSFLIKREECKG